VDEPPVNRDEQAKLLAWAKKTIAAVVHGDEPPTIDNTEVTPGLRALHGAFVTLTKHGELRGCIGMMDFTRPLWENVIKAATASALEDPRFPPVGPAELPELELEISVLEAPRPISSVDEFDHLRHGIVISRAWSHGLFLPQVAREQGWDKDRTLEMVCHKAGLPPDAWRDPNARLEVFTAFVFGDR